MKLFKKVLMVFSVTTLLFSLTSCFGMFGSDSSNDDEVTENEDISITVYDGDSSKQYSVKAGGKVKIDECKKKGYYSTGFYDSLDPNTGVKYFLADGNSIAKWESSNPTTFYVHYAPISEYVKENTYYTDTPNEFGYWFGKILKLEDEFGNALKSNPEMYISATISFSGYDSYSYSSNDWTIYFKNVGQYNEGNLSSSKIANKYYGTNIEVSQNYSKYSYSVKIPAEYILSGEGICWFINRGNRTADGYVKNLNVTYTLVDSNK